VLVALLLGVAAVSWGVLRLAENRGLSTPDVTWTAPAFVAILAAAVLTVAVALRRRISGARRPNPLGMARMAVLGKASAHVGPIVAGLYLGYLLLLLPGLDVVSRRDRALVSTVTVLLALLLSAAGLLLERTCRVTGSDDDEPPPAVST
jgi:hypothetical protein